MVTDGQRKVINMIENNLNIKFKGTTKEEAKNFISENIERSKRASSEYIKNYRLINIEEIQEKEEYTEEDYYNDSWIHLH